MHRKYPQIEDRISVEFTVLLQPGFDVQAGEDQSRQHIRIPIQSQRPITRSI